MHFVISPAKSLEFEGPVVAKEVRTWPRYTAQARALVRILKKKSADELGALMGISEALAKLNVARYQAWRAEPEKASAVQSAILAFNGDVYEGLDAATWAADDLLWAQAHVSILSGLYGVLRPLDQMQAYRLEMGTALANERGKNLYHFWQAILAKHFNKLLVSRQASNVGWPVSDDLAGQGANHSDTRRYREDLQRGHARSAPQDDRHLRLDTTLAREPQLVIVNLASQEYFKALGHPGFQPRVVSCVFEDWKHDRYKIIGFFAKRARGLMLRYAVQHRLQKVDDLKTFNLEGYGFDAEVSGVDRLVFRRRVD